MNTSISLTTVTIVASLLSLPTYAVTFRQGQELTISSPASESLLASYQLRYHRSDLTPFRRL